MRGCPNDQEWSTTLAREESFEGDKTTMYVRAAVGGSMDALGKVVERLAPLMRAQAASRIALELRNVIELEDVLLETWSRAMPRLSDLQSQANRLTPVLLSFLSKTSTNVINERLRQIVKNPQLPSAVYRGGEEDPNGVECGIITGLGIQDAGKAIAACIKGLSKEEREVILLRGIEGQEVKRIAKHFGLKPDTVSQRYRRAITKLRETIPESVFDEMVDE